jgi:hypothetical protein
MIQLNAKISKANYKNLVFIISIIKCFSNRTNITKMNEYGKEYFQGDKNELLIEILQIVKHYNK